MWLAPTTVMLDPSDRCTTTLPPSCACVATTSDPPDDWPKPSPDPPGAFTVSKPEPVEPPPATVACCSAMDDKFKLSAPPLCPSETGLCPPVLKCAPLTVTAMTPSASQPWSLFPNPRRLCLAEKSFCLRQDISACNNIIQSIFLWSGFHHSAAL